MMFPEAFKTPPVPATWKTNVHYHGWNVKLNRIFFANGLRKFPYHRPSLFNNLCYPGDPWRDATVSAEGLHVASTSTQPIFLSDGFHCSDLSVRNAVADPTVANVQTQALKYMATWLAEWKAPRPRSEEAPDVVARASSDDALVVKPINAWFRDPPVET